MFDNFKVANYSKSLLSPELFARHLSRLVTGDVLDGLTAAPLTGLQTRLSPGNAMIRYGASAVASARLVSLVATFDLTHSTADASNPRLDAIVLYVDNGVSLPSGTPTSANLDGKGVAKAKIVPGTPAANPSAPNDTSIQSSVGAGNPFTVLAYVRVNTGATTIAASGITDRRKMVSTNGDNLSIAEVNTGALWINEKQIYRKVIAFGTLPNATNKSVAHGIENIDYVVKLNGVAQNTTGSRISLPYAHPDPALSATLALDATNIQIQTGSNRTSFTTTFVIVEYTKA